MLYWGQMAAETIAHVRNKRPNGLIVYPREALRKIMDVQVERWRLPWEEPQWLYISTLGCGIVAANEYPERPYAVCFVPMPDGFEYVQGTKFPLIGGPRVFDQQSVTPTEEGLELDLLHPRTEI